MTDKQRLKMVKDIFRQNNLLHIEQSETVTQMKALVQQIKAGHGSPEQLSLKIAELAQKQLKDMEGS